MFVGKIVILASFSSTWIMLKSWMPTILWYYIRYLHIIHGKFSYVVKERRTALWSKHATLSRTSHSFKLPIVPYLIFFQRGWTDITSLNTISLTLNKEENSQLALARENSCHTTQFTLFRQTFMNCFIIISENNLHHIQKSYYYRRWWPWHGKPIKAVVVDGIIQII